MTCNRMESIAASVNMCELVRERTNYVLAELNGSSLGFWNAIEGVSNEMLVIFAPVDCYT